jgi:hypothetical protein
MRHDNFGFRDEARRMSTGVELRLAKLTFLLVASLFLTSCSKLEKARLRFDEDGKGQLTFTVRHNLDNGIPEPLFVAIQNCGFFARQSRHADGTLLDAIYEFSNSAVLGANLDCLPADWTHREVKFASEIGLLYTTYQATIWLEQKAVYQPAFSLVQRYFPAENKEDEESELQYTYDDPFFPMHLDIEVPGSIVSIDSESDITGYRIESNFTLNQGSIELLPIENSGERTAKFDPILGKLNAGKYIEDIPVDRYKLVITSRVARYEIGTLTAVLGALFGSGILVQIVVWVRSRHRSM